MPREYLGLYPYATQHKNTGGKETLWIHKDASTYTPIRCVGG